MASMNAEASSRGPAATAVMARNAIMMGRNFLSFCIRILSFRNKLKAFVADFNNIARALGYSSLHEKITPNGYRFLSKIKSLSPQKIEIINKKFKLKDLFEIEVEDFSKLTGVDRNESLEILEEIKKLKNELISKL